MEERQASKVLFKKREYLPIQIKGVRTEDVVKLMRPRGKFAYCDMYFHVAFTLCQQEGKMEKFPLVSVHEFFQDADLTPNLHHLD